MAPINKSGSATATAQSQYPPSNDQQSGNKENREKAIKEAKTKLETYRDGARQQNGSPGNGVHKQFQGVEAIVKDVVSKLPGAAAAPPAATAQSK